MALAKKKKEEKAAAVVPQPMPAIARKELVLEGDPEKQLEFAGKASRALMKRVESKPKKVIINGKQYLEFGDWQTLARFFGATPGVDWTKRIERDGKYVGYEAKAIVYQHGVVISSAEASCLIAERNWSNRDEYAVKSMAQTRASAKALRNAFGWVAEMAGYQSTPAEEMPRDFDTSAVEDDAPVIVAGADDDGVPADLNGQRNMLAVLLKHHGVDFKDKKEVERFVSEHTQLALTEGNFPEIIRQLKSLKKLV